MTGGRPPLFSSAVRIENRGHLRQIGGVRRAIFLSFLLAAGALTGCDKPIPATAATEESINTEPTHAQPKLQTMKLYVGAETLEAELALTARQEQTGMMFRTNFTDESAMLFVFSQPYRPSFWMKNCPDSLSAAYISPDGVIQEIHHLEQNDTNPVVAARDDIEFVLETKEGWFGRHNIAVGANIQTEKGPLAQVFVPRR